MVEITDEYMRSMLPTTKPYTLVVLRRGPQYDAESPIVWEHGRRNFALRAEGHLAIVCPVRDGTDTCGVGIFDLTGDETREVMNGDPGVRAGIFVYDTHPTRGFPGDSLPV